MMKTHNLQTKTQTALEIKAETETVKKIIASIIIILSGLILYLDKIYVFLGVELENIHGWKNTETYIWALCQTISPILIMLGMWLRPYFLSLVVPVACYSLQFYFVIDSSMTVDHYQTWFYVFGTTALIMFLIEFIKRRVQKADDVRNAKIEILEEIVKQSEH